MGNHTTSPPYQTLTFPLSVQEEVLIHFLHSATPLTAVPPHLGYRDIPTWIIKGSTHGAMGANPWIYCPH